MSNNELHDLLAQLADARSDYYRASDQAKQAKEKFDEAKDAVHMKLNDMKIKSARTDDFTISINSKRTYRVNDDRQVLGWLDKQDGIEQDAYITVNKKAIDGLVRELEKTTGELPDGIDVETSEYISLRKANNGKQ